LGSKQLEQLIAEADEDKDGGLNVDELASLVAKVVEQEDGAASLLARDAQPGGAEDMEDNHGDEGDSEDESQEEAKVLMEENDIDGDGKISTEGVLKLFAPEIGEEANSGLRSEQLEQLIAAADEDKDGGLNTDELAVLVAKVVELEVSVV